MNRDRFQRIEALFHQALSCAPPERSERLRRACEDDSDLVARVEALLVAHERASSFIASPAFHCPSTLTDSILPSIASGERIGGYLVRSVLGRGGMGVVYEAEQENPRRTVALKLIRPGLATAVVQRRFSQEAQVLGRLAHPGIAQIFEAGTAETAGEPQPFFAMEVVAGETITAYARAQRLSTAARLELFTTVCDAVQHAHEKGVLHRDLKPGNILITREGHAKILDFGVARSVGDVGHGAIERTVAGEIIGTLAYMSPEQIRGDVHDLDTRSDLYSLGVILYELVTDRMPYELAGRNVVEVGRIIAEKRPAAIRTIRREFPSDLDTILQKTLEKDRARRYASADALAGDIRRFLANRPILARPPSATYQLRKFVDRHRVASGIVAVLLFSLIGVTAISLWLAGRYADQRDTATRATSEERIARRSADAVVEFLESVLARANPTNSDATPASLSGVATQAESLLGELDNEPLVQARVMMALASVHVALADFDRAKELLDRVLDIRTAKLGKKHPDVGAVLAAKSIAHSAAGEHDQAVAAATESLAVVAAAYGPESLEAAGALSYLGTAQYHGRAFKAATPHLEHALDIRIRLLPDDHLEVASALANLGNTYRADKRVAEAVPLLRQCLQIRERRLGHSPAVCEALQNLAEALVHTDRDEARQLVERRLEVARKVFHGKHPAVATALNDLAFLVGRTDRSAACKLYAEALAIRRESLGPRHYLVAGSLNDLGVLQEQRGNSGEAERCHAEALEIRRELFGPRDLRVVASMNSLSVAQRSQGKLCEAAELAEQVLEIWNETYGPASVSAGVAHQNVGAIYVDAKDFDRAETQLRRAAEIFTEHNHPNLADVHHWFGAIDLSRGRFESAEEYYRRAISIRRPMSAKEPLRLAPLLNSHGVVLELLDRPQEARLALEESVSCYRQGVSPGDAVLIGPLVSLASIRIREGLDADPALFAEVSAIEADSCKNHELRGNLLALRGLLALAEDSPSSAVSNLREALTLHEDACGADHWRTAITRVSLGQALLRSGERDAAHRALSAAEPVLTATLGPTHTVTVAARDALSSTESSQTDSWWNPPNHE